MRLFYLYRIEDESGVSGRGIVAEGVIFGDGQCAMRWRTKHTSTALYPDMGTLEAIHGHGGRTVVLYEDMDLVHVAESQPVMFNGCQCFKPTLKGTELYDGWPGSGYVRIGEWLRAEAAKGAP